MRKFLPKSSGFTLIELMVVVAIIAILATIGFTLYSGVQSKARDAKRQGDIDAIAKAFEVNKVQGSTTYPAISTAWFAGNTIPKEASTTYTPQYTLVYPATAGVTGIVLNAAPTWAATEANINTTQFTNPAGTISIITITNNVPPAPLTNFTAFQICVRLESGTIFCKPNAQ